MSIYDELTALVTEITARGIPATMDPRNLDVPGALVDLEQLGEDDTLCGRITGKSTVYLVVPDHDHPTAIAELIDLYDKVSDLTTGAQTSELALPELPPLPALKLNPIQLED
jgi:hypothetical protein